MLMEAPVLLKAREPMVMTEIDVAVFANAERPLARIRHSAIIRLAAR